MTDLPRRAVLPPPRRALETGTPSDSRLPHPAAASPIRRRRRWILLGLLGVLVLGTWIGIRFLNRWRIESEGFRINTARRLSELTERRLIFSRFQQVGNHELANASLTITPTHQDLLGAATLTNLDAQFAPGSWLADDWIIRALRIRRAELAFQPSKPVDAHMVWQTTQSPVDRGGSRAQGFRLGMTSDPASVLVESGRIDQLDLTWPGQNGAPESLRNLEGNFRVTDQTVQLELINGQLDTAVWPPFPVRQINAQLKGTSLQIISARLGFTAEHDVRVSGQADLTPAGRLELTADISPVLLRHMLPVGWTNTVYGTFDASNAAWLSHFAPDQPGSRFSGPFRVKGLVLRGMPFVDKIANLLRRPELAIMEFPTCTGNFVWTPQNTSLTDLSASLQGDLLRLRGSVTVAPGESIAGRLTFEANEAYFAGMAPAEAALFSPGPEGYRSLTVTLAGRDQAITDDINIANPVIISNPPAVLERPRISLPPGTVPAAPPATPAPATPAPGTPAPGTPAAGTPAPGTIQLRPVVPPPVVPPPSDAELERSFNDIIGR